MRDFLSPLRLNNGLYLNLQVSLGSEETEHGPRWKVHQARYQYQLDEEPTTHAWLFRYDYLRGPGVGRDRPSAHLNLNAHAVVERMAPADRPLSRVHFPTRRMSIERVIALLADEFQVPCTSARREWRRLLAESEAAFLEIAHDPPLTA